MKILVFTHMYPSAPHPENGIFVQQQVESLRREGIDVDVLHVDVKKSKLLYPWSFVPLLKRTLTHHYDLIHAHYVFAGVVARCQFRVPLVLTHHGDETFNGWQAIVCWVMSRCVDRVIVVTEQMKRAIGLASAEVVPCGVDFGMFKPLPRNEARERLGLPKGKKLVLFAGDLSKSLKRFDLVKSAVNCLRSKGLDVDLVIAYKQPYEKIPLYMNACDVLVLPSEREGSPQVVKEAMACNLPVVAADVGDVAKILNGVDGCYICARSVDDISNKLRAVLDRQCRIVGRERVQAYELESTARRLTQIYEDVLSSKLKE